MIYQSEICEGLSWSVHTWGFSCSCRQISPHSRGWPLKLAAVRELSWGCLRERLHVALPTCWSQGSRLPTRRLASPEAHVSRQLGASCMVFSALTLEVTPCHLAKQSQAYPDSRGKNLDPQLFLCKCQRIWGDVFKPSPCFRQK